ncbi:hypothetical protein CR983_03650 [Candidatus Saccharibacteria bacterium]|nr:MAG: hypothetical protein CR983_03650 [Candidatus Saccharibacteria bacterium]
MSTLNHYGHELARRLRQARSLIDARNHRDSSQEKVNVVGAGGVLTAAYEQLRNAAENTEEHLLLQNAIRRFLRQLFITRDQSLIARSGNELVVELTLAGYVPNDSLTKQQVEQLSSIITRHYTAYDRLLERREASTEQVSKWTLDVAAVEAEAVIGDHTIEAVFVQFVYEQLSAAITSQAVFGCEIDDYAVTLYVAIHRALLKSDDATIRTQLLQYYQVNQHDLDQYTAYNQRIDTVLDADTTDKLYHVVDRQGAPFRILRRMLEDQPDVPNLLERRSVFLDAYEHQINAEYEHTGQRINRGVFRSVVFLVITKVLIGLAIELPYDLWTYGVIVWLPLVVNMLFPPLYMLLLRATYRLPSYANTTALVDRIDTMLYGEKLTLQRSRLIGRSYGPIFSVVYVCISIIIFAGVLYLLLMMNFALVHIAIFFVFLSAASFLGFRLSRLIREIEVGRSAQNGMTFVRDLVFLPFVVVGRWMSDKYSRVNIVTIILDMLIELPLKTVLRLVRQWGAFIDDRKDQM